MNDILKNKIQKNFENAIKILKDVSKPEKIKELLRRAGIKAILLPHQLEGVIWWLEKRFEQHISDIKIPCGGILADTMGLGKTLQSLCAILLCRFLEGTKNPTLIICPKKLMSIWIQEINSKTTIKQDNILKYYGDARKVNKLVLLEKVFIITSFEVISFSYNKNKTSKWKLTKDSIFNIYWESIIIDEADRIKNGFGARRSMAVSNLNTSRRLLLTGTPINNSTKDLLGYAKFMDIEPYNTPKWWKECSIKDINRWYDSFMLRREDDTIKLPQLIHRTIEVQLNEREMRFYDALCKEQKADFSVYESGSNRNYQDNMVVVYLLRLKQCSCDPMILQGRRFTLLYSKESKASLNKYNNTCCHCDMLIKSPKSMTRVNCGHFVCKKCKKINDLHCMICRLKVIFETEKNRKLQESLSTITIQPSSPSSSLQSNNNNNNRYQINNSLPCIEISSKTKVLIECIKEDLNLDDKRKIIVFSNQSTYLDLIEYAIYSCLKIKYVRLDGDVKDPTDSDEILNTFTNDKLCNLLLCSNGSGSLGFNLTCADRCYQMDSGFNPYLEQQAEKRIHRIGQTKTVISTRIVSNTSIEKAILSLQYNKKQIGDLCLTSSKDVDDESDFMTIPWNNMSVFRDIIDQRKK